MNNLRPFNFDNFIGQKQTIEVLKILVESSKQENSPLPHILISGPAGGGKTSLANILAQETDTPIQIANGGGVRSIKNIIPYLMRVTKNSILFIDEIHRLNILTSEFLYPCMEDFRIDLGEEDNISINLEPFTLIGATTEGGALPLPLYDRFNQKFHLSVYNVEDLSKLVKQNANKLSVEISNDAITELAKRARGTPRIANNLLSWTTKYSRSKNISTITLGVVNDSMDMIGIDQHGLDTNDRKYLKILKHFKKPTGIDTLVSTLNIAKETIERNIEPFLLRKQLIVKTSKGRILL